MQTEQIADFSREEKLREISREIALRRNVYRRRIEKHEMTVAQAERQLAIMLAIARDYGGHGDQHT